MQSRLASPGESCQSVTLIGLFLIMVVVFRLRQGRTFANAIEFVVPNLAIFALLFAANGATSFKGVENCSWKRRALMFFHTMVQLEILQVKFLAAFVDSTLCNDFLDIRSPCNICVYGCSLQNLSVRIGSGLGLDKIRSCQVSKLLVSK